MDKTSPWEQAYTKSQEPTPPKPSRRGTVTKPQIMAASAALFQERGYDRTSLDDIAKAVSITKPSLYYHFGSKEEILLECIRAGYLHLEAELEKRDDPTLSGRERLTIFLEIYLDVISRDVGLSMILSDDRVMTDAARETYDGYRRVLNAAVEQRLESGIKDGSIHASDTRMTSYAIFGMFNWVAHWNSGKHSVPVSEILDKFLALIFDGIGGRAA